MGPDLREGLNVEGELSPQPHARVAAPKRGLQVGAADVRVALGGGDGGVAEELLDYSEVGAVVQEEGGGGVAEHVGRYVALDAGGAAEAVENGRDALRGQRAVPSIQEEGRRGGGEG